MSYNSYIDWNSMSDQAIMELIGTYIKHHRIEQNRTQDEIALSAGVSRSTLSLLERGKKVNISTLIQVLRVLDKLSILENFKIERLISPMMLAEMDRKKRYRARRKGEYKDNDGIESDW